MPEEPFATVKTYPRFELGWNRLQLSIEVLVAVVVAAGLLGLFGTGPLSSATQVRPGFAVAYQRIVRRTLQTELTISLTKPARGSTFEVLMPKSFLADMSIASASPRASAMRVEPNGIAYVFDVGTAGTGEISFDLKPKGYGAITSPFLVGGEPVVLHQFIFP